MTSISSSAKFNSAAVRDALLSKVCQDNDLLSIGSTVSKVVQLTSDDDEALHDLAYLVLSDVALTQKVLRLANTVFYRSAAGARVTTVSRAIFLLGFDIVKTSALTMLLVDGLANKEHARSVRTELLRAICASVLGRELARSSQYQGAEEAAIAALFANLGRILVASHDHDVYTRIMALVEGEQCTLDVAALRIMGCTFELLSNAVLEKWKIPEAIARATVPLAPGTLKPPQNRQEWMQHVATLSIEAGVLMFQEDNASYADAIAALQERFGDSMNLSQDRIRSLLKATAPEVRALADSAGLRPESVRPEPPAAPKTMALPSEVLLFTQPSADQAQNVRHPDGKPVNARDRLFNGIQDVTQMMASGRCKANELMLLVLETLYCSMGFRFATLCLRDHKSGQYRARISLGEGQAEKQAGFVFAAKDSGDLFGMAMQNDVDLMISDASAPSINGLIPDWHRKLLPDARSFIVLSLVVDKTPIGFYYADRIHLSPEGIPADETALIKILKSQVVSMLQRK